MGKGGRFGKYGEIKRFERLRQKQRRPLLKAQRRIGRQRSEKS